MGTLYENIKALCDAKGIKAAEFNRQVGLPRNFMTELKAGRKQSIQIKTAEKIAEYFDVSVNEIVRGTPADVADMEGEKILEIAALLEDCTFDELAHIEMLIKSYLQSEKRELLKAVGSMDEVEVVTMLNIIKAIQHK